MQDKDILNYIRALVDEEQKLFSNNGLNEEQKNELSAIQVELDQYWDLLRQRRAFREHGKDPDEAKLRGPDTVEGYEQ